MPQILEKNKEKTSSLAHRRSELLSKDDVKTTFGYAVVGIAVVIAIWGVGYSFIKQVNKD